MKNSDDLYQLIASLTKAEKRYFKLSASIQSGDKSYLKLFDAIDKQINRRSQAYDEDKLESELKGEKMLKYLPVAKHYLYNLILKTLRTYKVETNSEKYYRGLLDDIKFLIEKGLYHAAKKKLKKAKAQAGLHEKHKTLIELAEIEEDVLRSEFDIAQLEENFDTIYETIFTEHEKLENLLHYKKLDSKLTLINIKHMRMRSDEDRQAYMQVMKHHLLANESKAKTIEAKVIFHLIHSVYHNLNNEIDIAYQHDNKLVKLARSNPEILLEHPRRCIVIFRNHILTSHYLKKWEETQESLEWLKNLKSSTPLMNDLSRMVGVSLDAHLCVREADFQKGYSKIKGVEQEMLKSKAITKELELLNYYTFAQICMGEGKYNEASKWLQLILRDDVYKNTREDIRTFARILNLIVQFERENQELVESNLKSLYRFLYKKHRMFAFEDTVIRFIRRLNRSLDNEKLNRLFEKLHEELGTLIQDPYEKEAFEYFDFISWVESRLEKRPFAEIAQEKSNAVVTN